MGVMCSIGLSVVYLCCVVVVLVMFCFCLVYLCFFLMIRGLSISPLFPCTTLFLSIATAFSGLPGDLVCSFLLGLKQEFVSKPVKSQEHTPDLQ